MDFFEAQERSRALSRRLILLYLLAVVGMMAVVYLTLLMVLGLAPLAAGGLPAPRQGVVLHPALGFWVVVGMGALIGGGAAFRIAQLRRGGAAVAELLGGRRVDPSSTDPRERMLLNVVEEMSIASGVPVPAVFVLDGEAGINAFAAGHTADDAAVAVTRGALEGLTRDELQGVVAHEFSHILNGDMRLNVRLMGLLSGILLLSVVGRGILRGTMGGGRYRGSGGRQSSGGQIAILGVVLVILGWLGVVFGRIIQAAVSRQREFLADAAAVEFTRNPDGLAGALKRIGASAVGSRLENHRAQEAGHFFFASGTGTALSRLTATHPPLPERIRRLDPHWDGSWTVPPLPPLERLEADAGAPTRRPGEGGKAPGAHPGGFPPPFPVSGRGVVTAGLSEGGIPGSGARGAEPGSAPGIAGAPTSAGPSPVRRLLADAGSPGPRHVDHARRLLAAIPPGVREAARTPEGAVALLLALLLDRDPALREPQRGRVAMKLGDRAVARMDALEAELRQLGPAGRLPLVELSLPAIRDLPAERAAAFRSAVGQLIRADGAIDPFEFAVYHMLRRSGGASGHSPARRGSGGASLDRLAPEADEVLSAVAWWGAADEEAATRAFRAGAALLGPSAAKRRILPRERVALHRVDGALERLEAASPAARKALLEAASAVVEADGRLEVAEVEMLRALAEALFVPLPPLVPDPPSESRPG